MSVKKEWTRNSKLAIIGLIASMAVIIDILISLRIGYFLKISTSTNSPLVRVH